MRPLRQPLSLLFPIAITTMSLAWLSGCIPIPGNYARVDGLKRTETQIGDERSKKPIRTDVSTKADIEHLFGPPSGKSADGRLWCYAYTVHSGGTLWLLCGYFEHDHETNPAYLTAYGSANRYVYLEFDSDGVLRRVKPRSLDEAISEGLYERITAPQDVTYGGRNTP
ncbi:MAG: hypothetical protein QM770_13310 [Tepidisphaeraceae bacterium]